MAITAMGDNLEVYRENVQCELASWANQCINHTPITPEQKTLKISAHQQQFKNEETLQDAYGVPIHAWGTLCYGYVIKRDRTGKMGQRAVRGIWDGVNTTNAHSTKLIPITRGGKDINDKWILHKPIHSAQVVVINGNFPLRMHVTQELPEPPEVEIVDPDEYTEESDEDETSDADEQEHEVQKVVSHNKLPQGDFEYKVRWKGFKPADDTWEHEEECSGCKGAIAEYWKSIAECLEVGFVGRCINQQDKDALHDKLCKHDKCIQQGQSQLTMSADCEESYLQLNMHEDVPQSAALKSGVDTFTSDADQKTPAVMIQPREVTVGEKLANDATDSDTDRCLHDTADDKYWADQERQQQRELQTAEALRKQAHRAKVVASVHAQKTRYALPSVTPKSGQSIFASDADGTLSAMAVGTEQLNLGGKLDMQATGCDDSRFRKQVWAGYSTALGDALEPLVESQWWDGQAVSANHVQGGQDFSVDTVDIDNPELLKPNCEVMMVSQTTVGPIQQYHDNIAYFVGDEMSMEVGGVETPLAEVINSENREGYLQAHNKELAQMRQRRFVREGDEAAKQCKYFKPTSQLTDEEKSKALRCRMVYNEKRLELEDEGDAEAERLKKARLVAREFKTVYKKDRRDTYAPTPTIDGFRMLVASVNVEPEGEEEGDRLSSTDYTTAYLQSTKWKDFRLMLIVYRDVFTGQDIYEWICGVIYGMQEGASAWRKTLCHKLTSEMGFYEVKNMESMYHHPKFKTSISCHVDDPLVKTKAKHLREDFYKQLNEIFDTKGDKVLSSKQALDYLSMRLSMDEAGNIYIDNEIKIRS